MTERIKVLLLASDPAEFGTPLRLDQEARAVIQAIRRARERDTVEVATEWAVRTSDLQQALLWHQPHIVHFAGHGSSTRGIDLVDDDGIARAVSRQALAGLFGILKTVRVVVLNACETKSTVEAFGGIVEYAVGMNTKIRDTAAVVFAEAFYGALASGTTVRQAFDLGVNRLQIEGMSEAKAPTLRIRAGVDPGAPLLAPARAGSKEADEDEPPRETPPGDDGADAPAQALLDKVGEQWIGQYLDPTLAASGLYIAFDYHRGVEGRARRDPEHRYGSAAVPGAPSTPIASDREEAEALDYLVPQCQHRMLVTGAPGSGKTVMMLKVVRWYLGRREAARRGIPVVLNLSTWDLGEDADFESWVVRQLRVKYQIGETDARRLVRNNRLVYILDGLDEVRVSASDGRAAAGAVAAQRVVDRFQAWIRSRPASFRADQVRYVIACREQTLRNLARVPAFGGTLHLRPLTHEQVLRRMGRTRATRNLYEVLARNEAIVEHVARNPYLLNVMLKTYCNDNISAEEIESVLQGNLRDELFAEYVKARIASKHSPAWSDDWKIQHWLGSVAHLGRAGGEEFLLEELQPRTLTAPGWRALYAALYLALVTLFVLVTTAVPAAAGLAVEWSYFARDPAVGFRHGVHVFLVFAAIIAVGVPLAFGLGSMSPQPPRSRYARARTRAARRGLFQGALAPLSIARQNGGLRFAALLALVLAAMRFVVIASSHCMALSGAWSNFVFTFVACLAAFVWLTGNGLVHENMFRVDLDDSRRWDRARMRNGALTGLAIGVILLLAAVVQVAVAARWEDIRLVLGRALSFCLTMTVTLPLLFGRTGRVSFMSATVRPNHGIRLLLRNAAVAYVVLISAGFFGLWFGYGRFLPAPNSVVNAILGLGFGVMALAFGLLGAIRHACLRLVLTATRELPLNVTGLLRYTTEIGLTRTVGGRYMFEHTSLREYFFDQHSLLRKRATTA